MIFSKALLCLKYWNGEIELPTTEQMLAEQKIANEKRIENGIKSRQCHLMVTAAVCILKINNIKMNFINGKTLKNLLQFTG